MRKRPKQKSTDTNLVRPSRDGDQFHYLWAARRCLNLLLPKSELKAVTIEGASPSEKSASGPIKAGEEVIDVAEYFGNSNFERASRVRYIQLKHSTEAPNKPWPPSGLQNTIEGFAKRYKAVLAARPKNRKGPDLEFLFVSNRPISPAFSAVVENVARGGPAKQADINKLEKYTGLKGSQLSSFCKLLRLEGKHDALWNQRNILFQDASQYLPDADVDAPAQLKELVTQKALSDAASNPVMERMDVLRALKTDEDRLYPAPCRIEQLDDAVPREQEADLVKAIVNAGNRPVIVHAEGGVGKSIFATRIRLGLPLGSTSVLYDCFGNGQYRSATGYRHRHKDALVQIVNELAGTSLCHLLIPTSNAGASDYLKKFIFRLEQAVRVLRAEHPQALLCIIVDAADNAQMAAQEIGEARSFIRDLLKEHIPDGVRLVALCRSHRQELLDPPSTVLPLELKAFSRTETALHLRHAFPSASEQDIDEFHRLSSHNPRVQALALSAGGPLSDILRGLGPNPTTVEKAIGDLLSSAIAKMRDAGGAIEKAQIDRICAGLAALRPLVPISVLSAMSGVPASAIKSFAYDLRRPLIVTGETIQFFDEPSETWFREKFKPTPTELGAFIAGIKPLSSGSAYVAAALPQLMLEAGQFDDLVALALSSEALPELSPLDRRDVELQRLQFALKASLRAKRYLDAAKLALKTGGETAGDERQRRLLQENTDLASVFMESDRIQELVSRRIFGSGWIGSHNAYEAALLSGHAELLGEARSRLRMAAEWLNNWSRLPQEDRGEEKITITDIGEIATAYFNIHGARACAGSLKGWTPPAVAFNVGRHLAHRLVDHGRYQDLDDLAIAAGTNLHLALAVILELREVHRVPPKPVIKLCLTQLLKPKFKFETGEDWGERDNALNAVTALVEACRKLSVGSAATLAKLLSRYLPKTPPRGLASHYSDARKLFLRAYALRAALRSRTLELLDLAHTELRTQLKKEKNYSQTRETQEFKEDIGALLPWYTLWATRFVTKPSKTGLPLAISETLTNSSTAAHINHREEWRTADEIAEVWLAILVQAGAADGSAMQELNEWMAGLKRPPFTPTLARLARRAARVEGLSAYSLQYATKAFQLTNDERAHADSKFGMYISLARSVLAASPSEAQAYFNQAVEVANKIGDENIDRWAALLDLAETAADQTRPAPEMAYRLSRCAEVTYDYVDRDKHFDWERTVEAIASLCPSSSFAILSRWRDRGFGRTERVLPMAVSHLIERKAIDARKALSLIGFRAHWNMALLLKSALEACTTQAEKQAIAEFSYRYMQMTDHSVEVWRELKGLFEQHRVVIGDLAARHELQERAENAKQAGEAQRTPRTSRRRKGDAKRDWNAVFQGFDLTVANDLSLAQQRFRKTDAPYYQDQFFTQAISRVSVGKEAEFIAALTQAPEFQLYHFRSFLESVPIPWKTLLAVKSAIANALRTFCRRYCMEVTRGRYYEVLPFKTACELAGVPESDVIDVVLSGIGEVTEIVGVGRLFTLVGLLSGKLSRSESLEALDYGLQLFDVALKDTDGDGPWSNELLLPPADLDSAIAGYIFGALASPNSAMRWEAAHAVLAVCLFGQHATLSALVAFADGSTGGTFADAGLFFYHLHARQWLFIALARAAKDRPDVVARHSDFVLKYLQPSEFHVVIRELAKRTALTLIDGGSLESSLRHSVSGVNISPFPAIEKQSYDRPAARSGAATTDEDRFYFGFDFGPYWLAPLARCFGVAEKEVEHRAATVIASDWNYSGRLHWEEDERNRRKIFKHEDMDHRHASYPRVDELRFYLSFHAMMVVAGQLLATMPTYRGSDFTEDNFSNWLHSRHDLSRIDGFWLADRRNPVPLDTYAWKHKAEAGDSHSPIRHQDFDRVLFPSLGIVTLWGYWTSAAGRQEEVCNIRSALVSPDQSRALLRALQSADDHHDYLIPDAEDDRQIDSASFRLKGWIIDRTHDTGIDGKDPWAGGISYPAPAPSQDVIEAMNLTSDREHRSWRQGEAAPIVMTAETWGTYREKDDDAREQRGDRVQVSTQFVGELLRRFEMDMIVEVEIKRQRSYSRYESRNDDEIKPVPPSTRVFLVKSDGRFRTI